MLVSQSLSELKHFSKNFTSLSGAFDAADSKSGFKKYLLSTSFVAIAQQHRVLRLQRAAIRT